ncbi:MAG: thermonuclease family protein [Candidatus Muiribacteriota bacterium]
MWKKTNLIYLVIFILLINFNTFADTEQIQIVEKYLTLKEVRSHTSFDFEEIGFARLAGLSGPRFKKDIYDKAVKEVENFLKTAVNKDGKLKVGLHTSVTIDSKGTERTYHYVIIYGNNTTLNEFAVKKGIAYTNTHTKNYFDNEKMKALEKEAKDAKLYHWAE